MEKQKLDPQLTLMDSAQCFHWRKTAHGYAAIVAGKPMFVRAGEVPEDGAYFDWDRDYGAIARRYAQFPALQRWMDALPGLRVLRQPVWEALVAFILSSNNNAVRIRQLVWKVCALGPQREIDGEPMRGFPRRRRSRAPEPKRCGKWVADIARNFWSTRPGAWRMGLNWTRFAAWNMSRRAKNF